MLLLRRSERCRLEQPGLGWKGAVVNGTRHPNGK
jgi:hypothetical protein